MSGHASNELVLGKAFDLRLTRRLWRFVAPHWLLLVAAYALIPLTILCEIAQPYLLSRAIDTIASGHAEGLGNIALSYGGFVAVQALGDYAHLYLLQLVGQRSMHALRLATYGHVLSRRTAFFDRVPVGRLLTRMTNDVENINEMFSSGVVTLVADLIKLLAIVGAMLYLNLRLTLITFLTLPVLFFVISYARRLMRRSYREIRVKLAAMNTHVQEHLSGLSIVQLFCREQEAAKVYDDINRDYRDAYEESIRADATMYAVVEAIGVVSAAALAWYASGSIGQAGLTIGLVIAFIEYVNKFFIPVRDFSAKYAVMQSAMASAERITGLLDTKEEDAPAQKSEQTRKPRANKEVVPAIELVDVHFSYRASEPVLRGLSLAVQAGQTVAVVGPTGSGKSTIIKLLTRLYETDRGSIFLSGTNICDLDVGALRRRITVVNQDVFLFGGTVRENVRMGNEHATDLEVEEAMERVGAQKVLHGRPDGIDTIVEARGENFSAGERQLISFARALVRNPELLVLDEATAHIDPNTEELIEHGIDELMHGRTTLVIAHRLSTIRHADNILVLDKGVVAEQGTYDELLAQGGIFSRLERSFSRMH